MPSKEKKSKKSKKYVPPPEEEGETPPPSTQEPPPDQNGGGQEEVLDPSIRMRFSFVNNIYQILLLANSRVNWEPEELVPVGMVLRDLKTINVQMSMAIEERRKEIESQENKDENSESTESSSTA